MSIVVSQFRKLLAFAKRLVRNCMVLLASWLHRLGVTQMVMARRLVRLTERQNIDVKSDRFVMALPGLHRKIREELVRQKQEYASYSYFHGHPYQALAVLGVFGERGTEERFDAYGLADIITRNDRILDIGCNCGFMALYASFRTGCSADGIDINPYMIRIGEHCTAFLQLQDKVRLIAAPFQNFAPDQRYTIVLSFATHWTDDRNYRIRLQDHLLRIHGMLTEDGLLIFESHSADVGNIEFYDALEDMRTHYAWDGYQTMANGSRELYLMHRRSA